MQLLRNQKETEKVLEEAQNARYSKEGEVSILRKSMEKVCAAHLVLLESWLKFLDCERPHSGNRTFQGGKGASGDGPN